MSNAEHGIWFELRPNGHPSIAVWNPKRYASLAEAETAAAVMRKRSPDFRFVEIVRCEMIDGVLASPAPVCRV
jgi:hypothetical protein